MRRTRAEARNCARPLEWHEFPALFFQTVRHALFPYYGLKCCDLITRQTGEPTKIRVNAFKHGCKTLIPSAEIATANNCAKASQSPESRAFSHALRAKSRVL
jgi:hypothetical protein